MPVGVILILVNAHDHSDVRVLHGGGDNHPFGPSLQVQGSFFPRAENTRGFHHQLHAKISPGQFLRAFFTKDLDCFITNEQAVFFLFYLQRKMPVNRIVAEQMVQGGGIG